MQATLNEIVEQRLDDAIAACTDQINHLDMGESSLRTLILSAGTGQVAADALLPHLDLNIRTQEKLAEIRGMIHAAVHSIPDTKVVHLEEDVF